MSNRLWLPEGTVRPQISRLDGRPSYPTVLVDYFANRDMRYLANSKKVGNNEVAWLGTVKELNKDLFLVDEIFFLEQRVDAVTFDLVEEDVARLTHELIKEGRQDDVNRIRFLGHVHPGNSVTASGHDLDQMDIFANGNPYFIQAIYGRTGGSRFCFYDYTNHMKYEDIPWDIDFEEDESRRAEIEALAEEKVTIKPRPPKGMVGNIAGAAGCVAGYFLGDGGVEEWEEGELLGEQVTLPDQMTLHEEAEEQEAV